VGGTDEASRELAAKLEAARAALAGSGAAALRLRGLDWFAWATCGGSAAVLLAAETGVAEVLVTASGAWVLTDEIERDRLASEELPAGLDVHARAWTQPDETERFVREAAGGGAVASDRPGAGERPLPAALIARRASLVPEEVVRYRAAGRAAAEAVTEVLSAARPEWTGLALAGAAAEALWARGLHPALTLAAGERRLSLHRHPTPSGEPLGGRAMLVVCARGRGLYANLTRFVAFRAPTAEERRLSADVARVEAAALDASTPGAGVAEVLEEVVRAYAAVGHAGEERRHHQGGPCGYLSRDVIARPGGRERLAADGAVAWNPSLPGAKIEDTMLVLADGALEALTEDPRWPARAVAGRRRPDVLER
jgi:Xaa-Pro aminopeptidase